MTYITRNALKDAFFRSWYCIFSITKLKQTSQSCCLIMYVYEWYNISKSNTVVRPHKLMHETIFMIINRRISFGIHQYCVEARHWLQEQLLQHDRVTDDASFPLQLELWLQLLIWTFIFIATQGWLNMKEG